MLEVWGENISDVNKHSRNFFVGSASIIKIPLNNVCIWRVMSKASLLIWRLLLKYLQCLYKIAYKSNNHSVIADHYCDRLQYSTLILHNCNTENKKVCISLSPE